MNHVAINVANNMQCSDLHIDLTCAEIWPSMGDISFVHPDEFSHAKSCCILFILCAPAFV